VEVLVAVQAVQAALAVLKCKNLKPKTNRANYV
jgi:hypothetical protein